MTSRRNLSRYTGYFFALPYLILFTGFVLLPLFYGLTLSLFRWEMLSPLPAQFVGIAKSDSNGLDKTKLSFRLTN